MGLREAQVRGASKNHRIPLGAARAAAQRALRARIAGMVREGCTPTGIARELDMTPRSVRSQIDRMRARGDLPPAVRLKPKPKPAPVATAGPVDAPVARPAPRPVMRLPAEARSAVTDLRQGRLARLAERHGADLVQALAALGRQRVYARLREVAQVHRVPVRTAEVIWHQVRP
ncbi:hypothetical protein [Mameliella alba]|uniref:Uncharacterized protein n=1 Tax=Mameliella alba TaxID=561184 RepID=A0A0B3S173_9RHOB|nr:hypothetical protein [Mameliella alba]KHQ50366.1 hypothetical protein OA50_05041 [Mameliella alba]